MSKELRHAAIRAMLRTKSLAVVKLPWRIAFLHEVRGVPLVEAKRRVYRMKRNNTSMLYTIYRMQVDFILRGDGATLVTPGGGTLSFIGKEDRRWA